MKLMDQHQNNKAYRVINYLYHSPCSVKSDDLPVPCQMKLRRRPPGPQRVNVTRYGMTY